MLYQMHEMQRAMFGPLIAFSEASAKMLTAPGNVYGSLPGMQRMAAGFELLYRIGKDYEKPQFNIRSVQAHGHELPIVEYTALAKPFCNLVRFKRFSDDA